MVYMNQISIFKSSLIFFSLNFVSLIRRPAFAFGMLYTALLTMQNSIMWQRVEVWMRKSHLHGQNVTKPWGDKMFILQCVSDILTCILHTNPPPPRFIVKSELCYLCSWILDWRSENRTMESETNIIDRAVANIMFNRMDFNNQGFSVKAPKSMENKIIRETDMFQSHGLGPSKLPHDREVPVITQSDWMKRKSHSVWSSSAGVSCFI